MIDLTKVDAVEISVTEYVRLYGLEYKCSKCGTEYHCEYGQNQCPDCGLKVLLNP